MSIAAPAASSALEMLHRVLEEVVAVCWRRSGTCRSWLRAGGGRGVSSAPEARPRAQESHGVAFFRPWRARSASRDVRLAPEARLASCVACGEGAVPRSTSPSYLLVRRVAPPTCSAPEQVARSGQGRVDYSYAANSCSRPTSLYRAVTSAPPCFDPTPSSPHPCLDKLRLKLSSRCRARST